jgi:hypothetical protein
MDMQYKIGYIDEDSKQVKLYTRKLRDFGFEVVGYDFYKGMTLDELMNQVYSSDIDLLMIDYRLNESNIIPFNGDEVERQIYENKPLFPHIIFTNKVDQAEPNVDDLKIIIDKEDVLSEEDDTSKIKRFANILIKSIEQYRNYINKKKQLISELLSTESQRELTASEKDMLLTTQRELRILDNTMPNEIPEQIVSIENLDKLTEIRKGAEEFLKSFIGKRKENES